MNILNSMLERVEKTKIGKICKNAAKKRYDKHEDVQLIVFRLRCLESRTLTGKKPQSYVNYCFLSLFFQLLATIFTIQTH